MTLTAFALCMGLAVVPPILQDDAAFNAICQARALPGNRALACTWGGVVYLPAKGADLRYIGHEFGHIAGDKDHDAVQRKADECLKGGE